jgi:hypothetical protein
LLPFATTLAILFFSTPTKYLKIYPPAEGCSKSFFAVDQQEHDAHGLICCKAGAPGGPCASWLSSSVEKLLKSEFGACMLPLLSPIVHGMLQQERRETMLKKTLLYCCIMAFRTIFLWILPAALGLDQWMERSLFTSSECWYAALRSCKKAFDFSDHLVMFIGHFFIPSAIECYVLLQPASQALHRGCRCALLCFHLGLTLVVVWMGSRTGIYYHTYAEMVTAAGISTVFLLAPFLFWILEVPLFGVLIPARWNMFARSGGFGEHLGSVFQARTYI